MTWYPIETLKLAEGVEKFNCLIADNAGNVFEAWYDVKRDEFYEPNAEYGDEYQRQLFPTHWMPLPLPPVDPERQEPGR